MSIKKNYNANFIVMIAENNVGQAEASTRLIVVKQPSGSMKTATMVGIIVLALILVFVTWLMAIYLLLSKEKKKLGLWKVKRTKALYHKIEMDGKVANGPGGGGGSGTGTDQPGFTTEEDDKYDAVNRKYRAAEDEAYEMSAKLLTAVNYKQHRDSSDTTAAVTAKRESGFSIRSPQKYR